MSSAPSPSPAPSPAPSPVPTQPYVPQRDDYDKRGNTPPVKIR